MLVLNFYEKKKNGNFKNKKKLQSTEFLKLQYYNE